MIKLAMLFHVSDCPQDLDIRPQDWSRAVALMDVMIRDVKTLVSEVAFDRDGKKLNKLRRLIPKDGVDNRTLLRTSGMKAREYHSYLGTLEETAEAHRHSFANTQGRPTVLIYSGALCKECSRNGTEHYEH